jgi:CRP/FNR family transcriptional regulator, dissimilatory nitrate respiration regulator
MNLDPFHPLPAEVQAIASVKSLVTGQILFVQQEPTEAIFWLKSGRIQLVTYTENGRQINHYGIKAGELFAEAALFRDHHTFTAIASAPSQVLILPKQLYLGVLRQQPHLAETFTAQIAQRLYHSEILMMLRGIRSAQQRVLHYLNLQAQGDGITIAFDRPLKEVSGDLGVTPETLSRVLSQLQVQRKINRSQRKITLCKDSPGT